MARSLWILVFVSSGACIVDDQGGDPPVGPSSAAIGKFKVGFTAFQTLPVVDAEIVARGDFNGDGFLDYAVGDWRYDRGQIWNAGRVLIYPTSTCGEVPEHTPEQIWTPGLSGLPGSPVVEGRFGYSLAAADFNGDGYDDLAIGQPGVSGTSQTYGGAAYILYGSKNGLTTTGVLQLTQDTWGIYDQTEGGDGFAHALTSADFNQDGYADLAVGVPFEGRHGLSQSGAVQVIRGSASGLTWVGNQLYDRQTTGVFGVATGGDRFGYSVAAGSFASNNVYPGLAIGVPGADDAATNAGAIHVLPGTSSGPTGSGSQTFNENTSGIIGSAASFGESFGTSLKVRDDNRDGADDLLVRNVFGSDCSEPPTHLLYGSTTALTATGAQYTCSSNTAPRFDLPVQAPQRPTAYVPPAGESVDNVDDLVELLRNGQPDVIILEDGDYDFPSEVRPNAADKIWARNLGRAVLNFGFYYQTKTWLDSERPEIHGLTFDIDGSTAPTAIVSANAIDGITGLATPMSILIEDSFFYGHDQVDFGVLSRRPDQITLRRLVVRDVHVAGINIEAHLGQPNALSPVVSVEDIDVAGVARPPGEAGLGDGTETNYFCRSENGLIIAGIDEVEVHRIRVRDTRCAGISLEINGMETSFDAGEVSDVDIDCAGFGPPVLTADGNYRPVRNAGLYLQQASELMVSHVVIGPHTYDGIRSEYNSGQHNDNDIIHHALIQSQRAGIAWDACSFQMVAASSVIEEASCAGVIDNYNDPAAICPDLPPFVQTNTVTGVTFRRLPPGAVDVKYNNANTCPLIP